MNYVIRQFALGLGLLAVSWAGLAQSNPTPIGGSGWTAQTKEAPAVASDGKNLYAAWKGLTKDRIWFSYNDGSGWSEQQFVTGSFGTPATAVAPALLYDQPGDQLLLAWPEKSSDQVYVAIWSGGSSWNCCHPVSGSGWSALSKKTPALGAGGVEIAWEGNGTKQDIWYSYYNDDEWQTQQTVSGSGWTAATSAAPTFITAYTVANGYQPILYWKGKSDDNVWYTASTPSGWTQQTEIEGSCSPDTNTAPASALFSTASGNAATVLVWKAYNSTDILASVYDNNGLILCGPVLGANWTAATNVAPAVANGLFSGPTGGTSGNILAWTDSSDSTILYIDPTNLPGLGGFAP